MSSIPLADPRSSAGYRPFPNLAHRNALQQRFEVPALVRALALPRGRRVLEVGCGRGAALPALARLLEPSLLAGLELEPELVEEARGAVGQAGLDIPVFQGDVRRLPFTDCSFDIVVDFGTCYHVADPGRALAEIERVLAPGGLFVHETPVGQLFAHPVRSLGRTLPWNCAPMLARRRHAFLWAIEAKA